MSDFLTAALSYQNAAFLSSQSNDLIKNRVCIGEQYQSGCATESEIKGWWAKSLDANIGIVTGTVSGLVVIDLDTPEAKERLKELVPGFDFTTVPRSRTGKGLQLFFQHPGVTIPNRAAIISVLDVRGDGGYAVAPPSTHPNGKTMSGRGKAVGSGFNDSAFFARLFAAFAENVSSARHCSTGGLMNAEFLYKGPLRKIGFRYSDPPWVFVMIVLCLAIIVWKSFW